MTKQLIKIYIISLFLISCSNVQKQEINYKILTPKSDWTYYSDSKITFSTNINSEDVQWFSDIDGYLGNGNGFSLSLSAGAHKIKTVLFNVEKTVDVYVDWRRVKKGQTVKYLVNSNNQTIQLPTGCYSPALIALNGSINKTSYITKSIQSEIKKDIHIDSTVKGKNVIENTARSANNVDYKLDDEKQFYVVNTKNQSLEPHQILAKVIKISDSYTVWYPVNPEKYSSIILNESDLDSCLSEIDTRIIPRLQILWGNLPDIDGDKKVSFLFTPTINEEQTAIGFFNSSDFYKRDDFSPYSNEMDVLYIAVPEPEKFSYSVKCISATIAHELTHAINYNIKTYTRVLNNEAALLEETFLDEAESHLSESLCGYGISGGNISTLFYYLNNMEKFSVCQNDYLGSGDSNGRRGATTMFLSWLFWKKGGIRWNSNNPLEIIDEGGISFIQKLVASNGIGWENIGSVFGKSTDQLYVEMVEELNACRKNQSPSVLDPYSHEPVQLFPDYCTYSLEETGKSWNLSIPYISSGQLASLIPYSFVFFESIKNEGISMLNSSKIEGQVIELLCLEE